MSRYAAVAACFMLLAGAGVAATAQESTLACDLAGPKDPSTRYTFKFNPDPGVLRWVEGKEELKIERHLLGGELLASFKSKVRPFPHDETFFHVNLSSGEAAINYLHDPTPDEIAACEKQQGWACKDPVVLSQYSESGTCTFAQAPTR